MKPANGSFPYLKIAKTFGLDYGDVVLTADHVQAPERSNVGYQHDARVRIAQVLSEEDYFRFYAIIESTVAEFKVIQVEGWN